MWLFPAEADPRMAIFSSPPAHGKPHSNNGIPPPLPSSHVEESKSAREGIGMPRAGSQIAPPLRCGGAVLGERRW